ncbi:MAG TPA: GGDEF domain-containing protein [Streptosporangiaceae bacterium]|jgi:diguanylate cyclase (GGDEF)-like protein/PAS domain S-box-containing protein
MSPDSPAWPAVGAAVAVVVLVALIRRARAGEPACRWLALAAAAWGVGFVVLGATAGAQTPAAIQLTLSDVLGVVGMLCVALGLLRLATVAEASGTASGRLPGTVIGRVADGCLLAVALFGIGWIAVLRHAYNSAGVGPGSFAIDLVHPAIDLIALSFALWLAVQGGRAALGPCLAVFAASVGDFLAVQARASGMHPGTWPQLAWLLAIMLLAARALSRWPVSAGDTASVGQTALTRGGVIRQAMLGKRAADALAAASPPLTTQIALSAAALNTLVTLIFAATTWGRSGAISLITGVVLGLALLARIAGLLRQAGIASALVGEAGGRFLQLADRTSDVVVLCDADGRIRYASKAVAAYGYAPDKLTGSMAGGLVHPDDLGNVIAVATAVRLSGDDPGGTLACRVRASDGTWRHVQATMSRYGQAGRPDLLLVTAQDVSDEVALRRQVTQLTFHDGLTGLPNRAYLEERTKDLLARNREQPRLAGQTGAIFLDLDGFTAINDSVGHGAGDLVLAQAGRRLRGLVPALDTVARWGGDEFAVLIETPGSPQDIVDLAERLARSIAAEPFLAAGRDLSITASVGVAFADSDVAEHLLRNADLAMARAKDAGGAQVEVFAAHMHADVVRRLELATDLRAAIDDGSLSIEYQPVVELSTSRVASVEALVRWSRHGEAVAAPDFLAIAEDYGLMVALGEWVLVRACQQVAAWRQGGWLVGLSVNFSLRQVSAPGFAEMVLTTLDEAGLSRSALTLEVTERVLIEIGEPVLVGLARLRQLGVRLAIDDFGTGYASLAYLRQLPVDIIKIDPSFVAGLGIDGTLAMLTRTIVQVGHDLGIEIVAEGIERPEQLELLRAMGCGLGQGYLMARPMTVPGIESLADTEARRLESALLSVAEDEPAPPTSAAATAAPSAAAPDSPATAPAG